MSTEILEDILDGSQSHPVVNRREARYKYMIALNKENRNGRECLHKVFKTVVKYMCQDLPTLGESGSDVSYVILDTRNFSEVTRFSDDMNKPWLKATQKEIKT